MKRQLFLVLNLSLVSCFVILGISIISPVLPQYALSFSIPVALVGWAVSAFALARMVMDIPAGFLADRFGRKRNMIVGLILIILSSIAAGEANNYAWLISARIVEGIGSALYMTSATTWVAQVTAGEARGIILANFQIPDEIKRERRRRKAAASSTKSREKEREMAIRSTNEAASAPQPAIIAAISRA